MQWIPQTSFNKWKTTVQVLFSVDSTDTVHLDRAVTTATVYDCMSNRTNKQINPKELHSCLSPCLLIACTLHVEILVTALYITEKWKVQITQGDGKRKYIYN